MDALARSVTAKQFIEIMAFAQMEPFDSHRADWNAAAVRETIFNMAVAREHRRPVVDFLLKFDEEVKKKPEQSSFEIAEALKIYAMSFMTPK